MKPLALFIIRVVMLNLFQHLLVTAQTLSAEGEMLKQVQHDKRMKILHL